MIRAIFPTFEWEKEKSKESYLAEVGRQNASLVVETRALDSLEQLEQILAGSLEQKSFTSN